MNGEPSQRALAFDRQIATSEPLVELLGDPQQADPQSVGEFEFVAARIAVGVWLDGREGDRVGTARTLRGDRKRDMASFEHAVALPRRSRAGQAQRGTGPIPSDRWVRLALAMTIPSSRQRHGWIRTVAPDRASGLLGRLYAEAIARAGKLYAVLRIQSLRPDVLRGGVQLYRDLMFGQGALSRAQRELLAVVVSRTNACEY